MAITAKDMGDMGNAEKDLVDIRKCIIAIPILALADQVREDSKKAVKTLHDKSIDVFMITGDSEQVAKEVSEELGIEGYFANVRPQKKRIR